LSTKSEDSFTLPLKPQTNSVYSISKSPLTRSRASDDLNEPSLSDKGAIIPEALSSKDSLGTSPSKGIAMQEETVSSPSTDQSITEVEEKAPIVVISGTEPIHPEEKAAMKTEEPPVTVKVIEPEKDEETVVQVKKEEDVHETVQDMLNERSSASASPLPTTSEPLPASQLTTTVLSSSTINDFKEEIKQGKEEIQELETLINSNEELQQQQQHHEEEEQQQETSTPHPESLAHSTSRSVLEDIKTQLGKLESQMEDENVAQIEEKTVKQQLQNVKEEIVVAERVINNEMISKASSDVTNLAEVIEKQQNQNLLETLHKSNSLREELEDRDSEKGTATNNPLDGVGRGDEKGENADHDDKIMKKLPSLMSVGSKDAGDDEEEVPATKESEQKFKIRLSDVADSDDESDA
jgi:hypothetical protein